MKTSPSLLVLLLALTPWACGSRLNAQTTPAITSLYSFSFGDDGELPDGGLIVDKYGSLYGTTEYDGRDGAGTIFTIHFGPEGVNFDSWYSFDGSNAAIPDAGLIQSSDGNFYGTTTAGGGTNKGAVFKLDDAGNFTLLHAFAVSNPNDGSDPEAPLIQGSDGNFYGTTFSGGRGGTGTVFRITPAGKLTNLHNFSSIRDDGSNADGASPAAALVQGGDGNLYGTTSAGGGDGYNTGHGTVFVIAPDGSGFHTLHSFTGTGSDGNKPMGALARGGDGNFYGTTVFGGSTASGSIFLITPSGNYRSLYIFTGGDDGSAPEAGLTLGSDGLFYGTTRNGGSSSSGTVFRMTPAGALTTLYRFSEVEDGMNKINADGAYPGTVLVQGGDGVFYGTTLLGGSSGIGTVFRLNVPPVITSAATDSGTVGKGFSYQITAADAPTGFGATGLPSGLILNKKTGLISGTPASTATGTKTIQLSAVNDFGTGTATLTLTIYAAQPPVITSPDTAKATEGKAFSYQIKATNKPTSYKVTGKPPGLAVDAETGLLSGTPTVSGTKTLTLSATNAAGTGKQTLTLTIGK